jgi:hypothetical protein
MHRLILAAASVLALAGCANGGGTVASNPYRPGSAAAACWAAGYDGDAILDICNQPGAIAMMAMGATPALAQAAHTSVTAPGGTVSYYIKTIPGKDAAGSSNMEIVKAVYGQTQTKVLVRSNPPDWKSKFDDLRDLLTGFDNLYLSPDAKTLYFDTATYATSGAVHALNLETGDVSFITGGDITCVVLAGEYQGDLILAQHRYFVEGGSYDPFYLYTPVGKSVGVVALTSDPSAVSRVCPLLSP